MEIQWFILASYILGSFVIGGIPNGFLISKFLNKGELTSIGSGNIGATNIYRVLGWKWAILVFVLDYLKGLLPLLFVKATLPEIGAYIMVSTLLGCIFSPFLKFKGGKGIATGAGILSAYFPVEIITSLIIALLLIRFTKIVSLSTLGVSLSVIGYIFYQHECIQTRLALIAMLLLIVFAHRSNIRRILQNKEKPIQRIPEESEK